MSSSSFSIKNKGFTLLEVMIAVILITVGVLSAFSITQKVISYTSVSKSRLIAIYLAQEGIEIVKNIRDTNWVESAISWDQELIGCSAGCEADYNDLGMFPYSGNPLKLEAAGFYNHDSGQDTEFKRKITIDLGASDKMDVSVLVEWEQKGTTYSVTVQEVLYNWFP